MREVQTKANHRGTLFHRDASVLQFQVTWCLKQRNRPMIDFHSPRLTSLTKSHDPPLLTFTFTEIPRLENLATSLHDCVFLYPILATLIRCRICTCQDSLQDRVSSFRNIATVSQEKMCFSTTDLVVFSETLGTIQPVPGVGQWKHTTAFRIDEK